ncbi:MAG: hypothetical protein ACWIPI_09095, partial [Polaribacter sp.]
SKNYTYTSENIINRQKDEGYITKFGATSGREWNATISSSSSLDNGIDLLPAIEYGKITEYYSDFSGVDNGKKVYTYETIPFERVIDDTRELYKHPNMDMNFFNCSGISCNYTNEKIREIMDTYDLAYLIIKPFKHGSIKKSRVL